MNVACIWESTYYRHIKSYVNPTIIQQWKAHQQQLFNSLSSQDNGLVLAGDGRCDSPGYSAKFGSYTLLEQQKNRVLDFQLVQVSDSNINVFSHFITFYYCVSFYYERVRTKKMNPVDFFSCRGNAIVWNVTISRKNTIGAKGCCQWCEVFSLFVGRNYYGIVLTLAYCFQAVDEIWLFERLKK